MATLREHYGKFADLMGSRLAMMSLLQHNLARGMQNEEILRSFLSAYLPRMFTVSTGFVLPRVGFEDLIDLSRQTDVLIYDSSRFVPAFAVGDLVVARAESVAAVIEVKTTLSSGALDEALVNVATAKVIDSRIYGYIFAFNRSARDKTIKGRMEPIATGAHPWQLPDAICVLEGSYIERERGVVSKVETEDDQLALFYYKLMRDLAEWSTLREIGEAYVDVGERQREIWFQPPE